MASLRKSQETVAKIKSGGGEPRASQFNEWKKRVHERVKNKGILQMMPVLFSWGRNDPSVVLARGLEPFDVIAEKNPSTRMIITNKAGPFHFREYPDEFNQNVMNFIESWESPRAEATQ